MRYFIAAIILGVPVCAYAWSDPPSPRSNAAANSYSAASSNALASSNASAAQRTSQTSRQSQTIVVQPSQQSSQPPAYAGSVVGSGTSGWNGSPVASAVAPSYSTYNPCAGQAASMAAQTPLFGLSAGGTNMDTACQVMNTRLPWSSEWAAATLCRNDRDVRRAALDIGHPCPQDWPRTPVAPTPSPRPMPEYCYDMGTWSPKEVARHPECGH